ncbi:MAG: PIN domain-containing protein [Spirochaetales bacterium]|nr:PIN domain-containing protein [Spirochaetales bacterium]
MTLIDTSVWVRFFKGADDAGFAGDAVRGNRALLHPLVFGELLLGGLSPTNQTLLQALPGLPACPPESVYDFIRDNSLAGKGVGWVDAAILCSARGAKAELATFDGTLRSCAQEIGIPCLLSP